MTKEKSTPLQMKLIDWSEKYKELLKPNKTIRVAVVGDVLITNLERRIIDTHSFQRLHHIRQLGTALFVYPSALHTRFDHSLGTLYMADQIIKKIRGNEHSIDEERKITPLEEILIRLYALIHDVPHIPFGHTLEDELQIFQRHDENRERIYYFIGPNSEIGKLIINEIGRDNLNRLLSIVQWDKKSLLHHDDAFIYDIVSNTICADLLDYLARDNYYCNLGVSIEYRFLSFLYLHKNKNEPRRVFVRLFKYNRPIPRRDTITDLCRLLETRYLIAERVYFHHAKITSGAMLGRAVYELVQSDELNEVSLREYGDDMVLDKLIKSNATVASKLGAALLCRKLHKQLHQYQEEEFNSLQSQDHTMAVVKNILKTFNDPERRKEFEDRVANEIGAEEGDVLVYCPTKKMNLKAAEMRVIWKGQELEFQHIDDPIIRPRLKEILEAHKRLWGVYILVSPELSKKQKDLVKLACDIQLITPNTEKDAKIRTYYGQLVDRDLSKRDLPGNNTSSIYGLRDAIVNDVVATAKDDRPFSERLDESIVRHFKQTKADKSNIWK
jgi:uncharacterized protein